MTLKEDIPPRHLVAEALLGIVRLLKAVGYYPPGHPSLLAAVGEAQKAFSPLLLSGGSNALVLTVRREGFLLADLPVGAGQLLLKRLAGHLFARRVQTLTILPELDGHDLLALARCLTLDPAEIQRQGGISEVLRAARVTTAWVNETDLSKIFAQKTAIEEEPPEEEAVSPEGWEENPESLPEERPSSPSNDLLDLLDRLRREEADANYRQLLQELISLLRLHLDDAFPFPVLDALHFLLEQSGAPGASPGRREDSRLGLGHLATSEVIDFLIRIRCSRSLEEDMRGKTLPLLLFYRKESARPLMERLTEEADPQARRTLMETIIALDEAAVPVLREHTGDPRWFVVRNAAALIGEIRRPEAIPELVPLLTHADLRVRREAVRALTRIGGPVAVEVLLQAVEGEDPEVRRQALLSLGALRQPEAVPTLLRLITRPDPLVRHSEVRRQAIRALGEIGSPEAIPALVRILKRGSLWRRALADEVRAAAAGALGEIGAFETTTALEKALDDRSPEVARAAALALKIIRKGNHESGRD